tara:strand:- start:24 stop:452 length:429 start_codon:yes stop_codon:yes gene_type:complete
MYSQLFKIKPSEEIIKTLLECMCISDINDNTEFTIEKLETIKCIDNFKLFELALKKIYIPCKVKMYLGKYEYKNIITVFRQLLKTIGYTIFSKEKYSKKQKYLIYKLGKIEDKKHNNNTSTHLEPNIRDSSAPENTIYTVDF